ncbi:8074f09c-a600-4d24-b0cb-35bf5064f60c [Thermothielavioides terrestris]|uniref:Reticulon-like protein n=1 Tax=Thermothielavioides terrestris TaxID=2587410 RepID=A0A446BS02_9PEZI|nr:8074f09c-a600-4d24-b0cb-35bf5064f60c [Thermothielavioides terrestris]
MADSAAVNGNPPVDSLKSSKPLHRTLILPLRRAADDTIPTAPDAAAAYNTVANGPVAQNVMDQSAKTSAELSNLAASRQRPSYTAATGQPLTHYHSFFSELLSWRNPRASAIAYAAVVSLIFSVRYLDILRWGFKLTWMVLGITIAAEVVGKALLNHGFTTQLRPRKYYTVPRETLDALIGDVHELINFFVIESQRVLFAENVYASAAAALAAFISYYLVRIVPYWGLAVIATTVVFFAPLVYTTNQEFIDSQLKHAGEVLNAQTAQLRSVAQKQTKQATQVTKQYMGDYTAKAQALIKGATHHHEQAPKKTTPLKASDFPAAPKEEPKKPADAEPAPAPEPEPVAKTEEEPLIAA